MDDCLFCAIVAGTVTSARVDEDERTVSFMDINPASEGHLLVVPRAHARDLLDIDHDDLAACALTAQRLARRQVGALGADGVNLVNCCGAAAWQTVFHFHLHVVPRYVDDPARDTLTLPWVPTPGPRRDRGDGRAAAGMIRDLTDDEARAALVCKWGEVEPDVLPAWVAEMDYAIAEPITRALHDAVAAGVTGYPTMGPGGPLGAAYAGFAARQFGRDVDPARVWPTVDVTAGVRLVLDVLAPAGGLVFPVPGYTPQHAMAAITGRERFDLVVDPDAERAELDLDRLDRHFADGARVLLLTQPHNPWGRAFTRAELEGVRDVVLRHGGFVVSDEIHAPLVLDGREHVSYLGVDGTADHAAAIVASSKAFNTPGLKCAQVVTASARLHDALAAAPLARNDSWSVLGVVGAQAAYDHGDAWLAALRERLAAQRDLLVALLAEHLSLARLRPVEATYLAWLDLRAYGHDDPAAVALERGRVRLAPGHDYQPGLTGHLRLNFATSPERLTAIVHRLATALT